LAARPESMNMMQARSLLRKDVMALFGYERLMAGTRKDGCMRHGDKLLRVYARKDASMEDLTAAVQRVTEDLLK